ncbi:hypothetical protein [Primorskyibacter sp. 2E233]|uniref:hypothetical protein n=1 Tax=Primorskyibacter sp. 2E233 TaxID=3413431 RepID=UPI003BEFCFD1
MSCILMRICAATGAVALGAAAPVAAQNLINQNTTILSNLCVGSACASTETYAEPVQESIVRISNNRVRIEMVDGSNPNGDFPTNDWSIFTNDPDQFGQSYFAVSDDETGRIPFRIDAGAPTNSLFVSDTGRLGLGTSTPTTTLHIEDGSLAAMRLHRNPMRGFPDADWRLDVGGTGLFFTDLAQGTAVMVLENGAPPSALRVRQNGNVGLGFSAPTAALHVRRVDGTASVLVENASGSPSAAREMFKMANNGGSYFTLDNTQSGTTWYFVHENAAPNRFIIADGVNDGPELTVSADGDLEIQGQLFTAGSCVTGCDRVFDEDYPLPTIPEQAAMMRANKHLPNVGPTPEDGPFNVSTMTTGMLNELEKAHLYIAQLYAENAAQEARIARLEAQLATLAAGR